jgi:hypothetical protein
MIPRPTVPVLRRTWVRRTRDPTSVLAARARPKTATSLRPMRTRTSGVLAGMSLALFITGCGLFAETVPAEWTLREPPTVECFSSA